MDFKVPEHNCLKCGAVLNATSNLTGTEGPQPGNLCVCIKCGHVMQFDDKLQTIEASDEALMDVAGDPMFVRAMEAIGQLKQLDELMKKRK